MYLSQLQNISLGGLSVITMARAWGAGLHAFWKCICLNHKMYLSKKNNVFVKTFIFRKHWVVFLTSPQPVPGAPSMLLGTVTGLTQAARVIFFVVRKVFDWFKICADIWCVFSLCQFFGCSAGYLCPKLVSSYKIGINCLKLKIGRLNPVNQMADQNAQINTICDDQ